MKKLMMFAYTVIHTTATIVIFILMFLASFKGIKNTQTYSEPGHSHMEADTTHATTEKHKKLTNALIEVTREWITTIRSIPRIKKRLQSV